MKCTHCEGVGLLLKPASQTVKKPVMVRCRWCHGTGHEIKSLFESLTDEHKKAVLEYDGPEF